MIEVEGARTPEVVLLERSREREKAQTLFYRRLAAWAEEAEDEALAERFNELHADEQHHLSRLTARILELGAIPTGLPVVSLPEEDGLEGWEGRARGLEEEEVDWYESLLENELNGETRALIDEILESERHHRDNLGGKWMSA